MILSDVTTRLLEFLPLAAEFIPAGSLSEHLREFINTGFSTKTIFNEGLETQIFAGVDVCYHGAVMIASAFLLKMNTRSNRAPAEPVVVSREKKVNGHSLMFQVDSGISQEEALIY